MTHLFYESDALGVCESQQKWPAGVLERDLPVEMPAKPNRGASERDYRAYYRACLKSAQDYRHCQLRSEQRDRGYLEYQRLFAAQERLREEDYGSHVISDALDRLPKLVNISTYLGCSHMPPTSYLCEGFKASLHRPYGDYGHSQPNGVPQMRSLLLGCHQTGRQLTKLIIGDVNWQFLRDEADNINMMKQSLRHLRVLDLTISTAYDFDKNEPGPEIPKCREYLTNNALCDFVKAAPELESLSIAFNCYTTNCATELKHIVRDHHWKNLKRVEFEQIDATQADFASFFIRHASTLRHLGLRGIRLLKQGEWVPTLEGIQKTLSLDSASIRESLYCKDPPQYWGLDAAVWEDDDDEEPRGNITSKAVSDYLVHGGSCPLLDEEKHPNEAIS